MLLAALGGLAVVAVVVVGIVALGSRGSGGANPAAVTWPPSAGSLDPAMKASVAVTLGHVTPHLPWAVQDASVVSGDGVVYAVQQLPDNIQGQPSVVLVQGQGGNWSAIDETSDSFCQTLMHMHAVGAVKDSLVDYFSGCES